MHVWPLSAPFTRKLLLIFFYRLLFPNSPSTILSINRKYLHLKFLTLRCIKLMTWKHFSHFKINPLNFFKFFFYILK
jgi:hypothetical protein